MEELTFDGECPHVNSFRYMKSDRSGMQGLHNIIEYWKTSVETKQVFHPRVHNYLRVTETAFCFGCFCITDATWREIGRDKHQHGLERAHLHDACLGGSNGPENIIPLCYDCHRKMTHYFMGCRQCALLWIRDFQERRLYVRY